jgi:WhiB family transcriptional regulator, redox-sensing transcriptional regulator
MRPHGTQSCYRYGPTGNNTDRGCRCDKCVETYRAKVRFYNERRYSPKPYTPPPDMTWRDDAACKGIDPDLFHPERGDMAAIAAAKAVCAGCEVRVACLEYAIQASERYGVWGGLSERERRRLRRARRDVA